MAPCLSSSFVPADPGGEEGQLFFSSAEEKQGEGGGLFVEPLVSAFGYLAKVTPRQQIFAKKSQKREYF